MKELNQFSTIMTKHMIIPMAFATPSPIPIKA